MDVERNEREGRRGGGLALARTGGRRSQVRERGLRKDSNLEGQAGVVS